MEKLEQALLNAHGNLLATARLLGISRPLPAYRLDKESIKIEQ
ncbi:helix-turn-helix domain-containing protein [Klebsiella oxytoca]|nr:hypothetical protein [Klebsiella oxytoca]MBS6498316.1 hypothetical protein [Klebsiella oxytoca]HEJ9372176.1 hypothetical protein [Klebsiella oxytoca]